MALRYAAALLLATLVWGCASAKGAYTDGMDRETHGDYAGAAHAYALALERDRSLDNVPGRLAVAGREAVARWVAGGPALGRVETADRYLAAAALIDRAGRLGVTIERPATFTADHDAALDAAVESLVDRSRREVEAAAFRSALGTVTQAQRYRPTAEQAAALGATAFDAHVGWARFDAAAGRYRAAYDRAHGALALAPSDAAAAPLLDLIDAVVVDGTRVAAVAPAESDVDLPTGFLRDLDDVLADAALATADPFLAFLDPADVRREVRASRRGPSRRPAERDLAGRPQRLALVARALDADAGVAVAITSAGEEITDGEPTTETARRRRGRQEVTYTVRRRTLAVTLDATVVVVDAASRRVVCEEDVRQRARDRYSVATFDGDASALDLSRDERRAFADDVDDRAADRVYADLLDQTATALAAATQRCLARLVP